MCRLDYFGSGQNVQAASSKRGIETLGFRRSGEFLDYLTASSKLTTEITYECTCTYVFAENAT